MPDTHTTDLMRHRSVALRQRGGALLEVATHDTIKAMVRRGLLDVDDADARLNQRDAANRPQVLKLVTVVLDLADRRLTAITEVLQAYGPDARAVD